MLKRDLFYGLCAALIGVSMAVAPAMAQTSPTPTQPAAKAAGAVKTTGQAAARAVAPAKPAAAQSDKKPGQSCDGMDKKSKAYSDCVKAQAQRTKTDKKPAGQAAKATDKAQPVTKTN